MSLNLVTWQTKNQLAVDTKFVSHEIVPVSVEGKEANPICARLNHHIEKETSCR